MTKFLSYYITTTLLAICLCFLPLVGAEARQTYSTVELSWGSSISLANSFWKTDRVDFSSFSLRYEYRLLPKLSLGAHAFVDYHFFEGVTSDEFWVVGNMSDRGGVKVKEQILVPLMLSARYYPLGEKKTLLRPYVGLGAGTRYNRLFITGENEITRGEADWGWVLSPEIGARMPVLTIFFVDVRLLGLWSKASMYDFIGDKSTFGLYPQLGVGLAF